MHHNPVSERPLDGAQRRAHLDAPVVLLQQRELKAAKESVSMRDVSDVMLAACTQAGRRNDTDMTGCFTPDEEGRAGKKHGLALASRATKVQAGHAPVTGVTSSAVFCTGDSITLCRMRASAVGTCKQHTGCANSISHSIVQTPCSDSIFIDWRQSNRTTNYRYPETAPRCS